MFRGVEKVIQEPRDSEVDFDEDNDDVIKRLDLSDNPQLGYHVYSHSPIHAE